jgi:heme/copper-type cytochrome/quinol oxidase subunit 2
MTYGITLLTPESYQLHKIYFELCCGMGVIVMSILLCSLVKHRKYTADTHFHKYLIIDLFWAIFPFLMLVLLILPAAMMLFKY